MIDGELQEGAAFRFLELMPDGGADSQVALVYLHGAGERGEDLSLVKRYGLPALLDQGLASASCAVICPQLETDDQWPPLRVAAFVGEIKRRYARVVLAGYSLGGQGVCEALRHDGALAELAVVIAGRGPDVGDARLNGLSLVVIQGALDPWPDTEDFVRSAHIAGADVLQVVVPERGHYISEEVWFHPAVVPRLRAAGVTISPLSARLPAG